jgi:5'-deoxynucleotidase
LSSLPDEFQALFSDIIVQDNVESEYKSIVKAADILVAYIKALDEINHKNPEFEHVKERLEIKINDLKFTMPEVEYFMETFLQACSATVDKLSKSTN